MMSDDFRFKRFSVRQANSPMKVGTDGVLLGAWCGMPHALLPPPESKFSLSPPPCGKILDIGTGTGLIALMVAQRTENSPAAIDAVETDRGSCVDAEFNAGASPWGKRIKVHNTAFQDFAVCAGEDYDLVVSNPPFFDGSLPSPDGGRLRARHTVSLAHDELVAGAAKILRRNGLFSVILPFGEAGKFIESASGCGLYLRKFTGVCPTERHEPKRALMEFVKMDSPVTETERGVLIIEKGGRHMYSPEYMELTKEFYLRF